MILGHTVQYASTTVVPNTFYRSQVNNTADTPITQYVFYSTVIVQFTQEY